MLGNDPVIDSPNQQLRQHHAATLDSPATDGRGTGSSKPAIRRWRIQSVASTDCLEHPVGCFGLADRIAHWSTLCSLELYLEWARTGRPISLDDG